MARCGDLEHTLVAERAPGSWDLPRGPIYVGEAAPDQPMVTASWPPWIQERDGTVRLDTTSAPYWLGGLRLVREEAGLDLRHLADAGRARLLLLSKTFLQLSLDGADTRLEVLFAHLGEQASLPSLPPRERDAGGHRAVRWVSEETRDLTLACVARVLMQRAREVPLGGVLIGSARGITLRLPDNLLPGHALVARAPRHIGFGWTEDMPFHAMLPNGDDPEAIRAVTEAAAVGSILALPAFGPPPAHPLLDPLDVPTGPNAPLRLYRRLSQPTPAPSEAAHRPVSAERERPR